VSTPAPRPRHLQVDFATRRRLTRVQEAMNRAVGPAKTAKVITDANNNLVVELTYDDGTEQTVVIAAGHWAGYVVT